MSRENSHASRSRPPQGVKRPRPASSHAPGARTPRPPFRQDGARTARPPQPQPLRTTPTTPSTEQTSVTSGGQVASTASRLFHPFQANFNDHFETSREALEDVLPVVAELRQMLRPSTPEKFTLYDPYYCSGTVVTRWRALGVQHVLHENRDFYQDIRQSTVPGPYDMLVTNPPFSDDHMIRMLNFLVSKPEKPWAFLAPDYVVSKPWYKAFIRRHFSPAPPTGKGDINAAKRTIPVPITVTLPPFLLAESSPTPPASTSASAGEPSSAEAADTMDTSARAADSRPAGPLPTEPFYLVPRSTYDFEHPTNAGHAHSHFKSMWYVWCGPGARRQQEVMRGAKVALLARHVEVVHGLVALKESGLVSALQK